MEITKRPIGIWLISAYVALGTFGYVAGLVMLMSNQMPEQSQSMAQNTSMFSHIIGAIFTLVLASAGVALFLFKRKALPLFVTSLVIGLLSSAYNLMSNPAILEFMKQTSYVSLVLNPIIKIVIIIYCIKLIKKNVLV
ncbi:MAG: hypothetical protein A2100_02970 [Sideroxydans sp. GWF2_59_14]|nr:MAG: hypothetical protein A2100_02970 [Sideroxydans sp. GWF2_59_14]